MSKLTSRKFWITILTLLSTVGVALTAEQMALYALVCATVVTVAYTIAQAWVDARGEENTNVDEVLEAIETALDRVVGSEDE